MTLPRRADKPPHIVFLTRDPMLQMQSGSTTYVLGLLALLLAQGAAITYVVTSAASRSPRLFFRPQATLPAGVVFRCPGYWHLGSWYVLPLHPRAWARALARAATRRHWRRPVSRTLEALFGKSLYTGAWDLTAPRNHEAAVAMHEIKIAGADTVIANYAFWGPLLARAEMRPKRTAILMHDLLSARVRRFQESGTPLDMPEITEQQEMEWLSGAETVLAAQEEEAQRIRPLVRGRVMVCPVVLTPCRFPNARVEFGRCLFVGSDIAPNRAGLAFLLEEVWPSVRLAEPQATLAVVGTVGRLLSDAAHAGSLQALGVDVLGSVPVIEEEYARASVCLVPLLFGTGIKIKLLEALRFGKAVVATPTGIQGLEHCIGDAVALADGAPAFIAAIVRLLQDNTERRRREAAAHRLIETEFGGSRSLDPEFQAALFGRECRTASVRGRSHALTALEKEPAPVG